jgi:hypothetical protein
VGIHPEHGPLMLLSGVTGASRGVRLTVQANSLPMTLVDVDADAVPGGRR